MERILAANVYVEHPNGETILLQVGDKLPAGVEVGEHCLEPLPDKPAAKK